MRPNRCATAQDVARNATQAAQAASQGMCIVDETSGAIGALAEEIGRGFAVVASEVAGGPDEPSAASAQLTRLAEQQPRRINQFEA